MPASAAAHWNDSRRDRRTLPNRCRSSEVTALKSSRLRRLGRVLTCVPDHGLGRFALGKAVGLRDHRIDHQAVAVVGERVPT